MDARLASRRFYLARAPTSSHKSTPPSPVYSPPSSSLFPQHRAFSSLDAWAASVRHFLSPWQSCSRCTAWLSPIFLPSFTDDDGAALCALGSPCLCLLSSIFSEHLRP